MKKIIIISISLSLILLLSAWHFRQPQMQVVPTKISQDTKDVIALFDHKLQVIDIYYTEEVKTRTLQVWTCHQGRWKKSGHITNPIDNLNEHLEIYIHQNAVTIQNKTTKYQLEVDPVNFSDVKNIDTLTVTSSFPITINRDYILMGLYGNNQKYLPTPTYNQKISSLKYEEAIALVLTTHN